ncbi:hypothetical protein [Cupriavidus sp. H18C2]|uniref:hypothetical protein n=1 Tax=Cupriavidus sp. H18C2 TaxID=3241602 RepID=UPI003BF89FF4
MRKIILGCLVTYMVATQSLSAIEKQSVDHNPAEQNVTTWAHVVGSCHFRIEDMFGGEFRVSHSDKSFPQSGSYYLPITGPDGFLAGGFGISCIDSSEEKITSALGAKYEDGHWMRYGPVNGPEFVPYEKQASARTISLKGKNWTGRAYTEDDTTGDERRRARVFHFCLIHNDHALCGYTVVEWLSDRKKRNDLDRIKAILESVEFVETSAPDGVSAAALHGITARPANFKPAE